MMMAWETLIRASSLRSELVCGEGRVERRRTEWARPREEKVWACIVGGILGVVGVVVVMVGVVGGVCLGGGVEVWRCDAGQEGASG